MTGSAGLMAADPTALREKIDGILPELPSAASMVIEAAHLRITRLDVHSRT
jgi:hypothetical protein